MGVGRTSMRCGSMADEKRIGDYEGLHVAFVVERMTHGGTERASLNIAQALAKRGLRVTVVVLDAPAEASYDIPQNLETLSVRFIYDAPCSEQGGKRLGNDASYDDGVLQEDSGGRIRYDKTLRAYRRRAKTLGKVLRELSPSCVIAFNQGYVELFLARVLGTCKTVLSERYYPRAHYGGKPVKWLFSKLMYSRCDCVVFQTVDNRDCYGTRIREKSAVVANMVTPNLPRYNLSSENRAVVTMSRLEPQKNLALLIEAFARFRENHPAHTLRIYGDGSQRDNLQALIRERGLEGCAQVLPFHKNVHEAILDARMFVSTSRFEGIQNSLLECLAMGMPCIATDCAGGGARELLASGERGILVPVDDRQALVDAMSVLAEDDAAARRYGDAGLMVNNVYSEESIVSQWLRIVCSVCGKERV